MFNIHILNKICPTALQYRLLVGRGGAGGESPPPPLSATGPPTFPFQLFLSLLEAAGNRFFGCWRVGRWEISRLLLDSPLRHPDFILGGVTCCVRSSSGVVSGAFSSGDPQRILSRCFRGPPSGSLGLGGGGAIPAPCPEVSFLASEGWALFQAQPFVPRFVFSVLLPFFFFSFEDSLEYEGV